MPTRCRHELDSIYERATLLHKLWQIVFEHLWKPFHFQTWNSWPLPKLPIETWTSGYDCPRVQSSDEQPRLHVWCCIVFVVRLGYYSRFINPPSFKITLEISLQISSNCQRLIQGQPPPSSDTSKQHLKRVSAFGHTWGHPLEHGTLDVTDRDTAAQPVDLSQLFSSELQPFGCSPTDVRRVCYHTLWVPVVRLCRFRRLECHAQTTAPDPSLSRLQNTNFWKMVLIVWASYSIPFSPGASKQALKTLQGDLVRKRTYKNTHPALHRHLNFTNTLLYQHLHIIIYVYIIYVACSLQWGEQTFNVQALPHMRAPHRDNRVLKRRKWSLE